MQLLATRFRGALRPAVLVHRSAAGMAVGNEFLLAGCDSYGALYTLSQRPSGVRTPYPRFPAGWLRDAHCIPLYAV